MEQKKIGGRVRLGLAIRAQRESQGFCQESYADKIRMHRTYYSAIELGEQNMILDTSESVCKGMGCEDEGRNEGSRKLTVLHGNCALNLHGVWVFDCPPPFDKPAPLSLDRLRRRRLSAGIHVADLLILDRITWDDNEDGTTTNARDRWKGEFWDQFEWMVMGFEEWKQIHIEIRLVP
jgi:hypothetical protein